MVDHPDVPTPRRRWRRRLLRAGAVVMALLVAVYLLRGPLLARPLGALLGGQLSAALGGEFDVGAVRGNWFGDLVIEDLRTVIEPDAGVLRRLEAEHITLDYGLWTLITAPLPAKVDAVEATGVVIVIDRAPPTDGDGGTDDPLVHLADALLAIEPARLPRLSVDGRLELRPGIGAPATIDLGLLEGEGGTYRTSLADLKLMGQELGDGELTLQLTIDGERAAVDTALTLAGGVSLAAQADLLRGGRWSLDASLEGLGQPVAIAGDPDGWRLATPALELAMVPAWAWGLARLEPTMRPESGELELAAQGDWSAQQAELSLAAKRLRAFERELDRLHLSARWDNGHLVVPELTAQGIGSELRVIGLELKPEAPYLVALGEATASSDDVALAARLLDQALPVRLPPGQDAQLTLSGAIDDEGRLALDATLSGAGIAVSAEGLIGAELFSPAWRSAAVDLSLDAELDDPAVTATGVLTGALGAPDGSFDFSASGVALRQLQLDRAELRLAIAGGALRVERCLLTGEDVRITASGGFDPTTMRVIGAEAKLEVGDLSRINALLEVPVPVSGRGLVDLRFEGRPWPLDEALADGRGELVLVANGLTYAEHELPALELALAFEPGNCRVRTLDLTLPDGLALSLDQPFAVALAEDAWSIDGLALSTGDTRIDGRADGRGWNLGSAELRIHQAPCGSVAAVLPQLPPVTGSWSGSLAIDRFTGIPRVDVSLRSDALTVDGVVVELEADLAQTADTTMIRSLRVTADGGLTFSVEGEIPWWFSLGGVGRRDGRQPQLRCAGTVPVDHPLIATAMAKWLPTGASGQVAVELDCASVDGELTLQGRVEARDLAVGPDRFAGELRFEQDAGGLSLPAVDLRGSRGLELRGALQLPLRIESRGYRWLDGEPTGRLQARIPCDHPVVGTWLERWTEVPVGGLIALELTATEADGVLVVDATAVGEELTLAGQAVELALDLHQDVTGIALESSRLTGAEGMSLEASGRLPMTWSRAGATTRAGALEVMLDAAIDLDAPLVEALIPDPGRGRLALTVRARRDADGGDRAEGALRVEDFHPNLALSSEVMAALPGLDGGASFEAGADGWTAGIELGGVGDLALELGGDLALELGDPQRWGRLWIAQPWRGTYRLSLPDLSWLASLIPMVSATSGALEVTGAIAGSPEAPTWDGVGRLDEVLVQNRSKVPTVSSGSARFHLAGRELVIDDLVAELGYEQVHVAGRIPLDPWSAPVALTVSGTNVLLYRDQSIRLRADLECSLKGTMDQLVMAGRVGVSEMRYVRNFGMFDTGSSGVPSVELQLFELEQPILSTMRFDIDVVDGPLGRATFRPDPIRIRTNLVRADLALDLHLGGTGREPVPSGTISTRSGTVFMPFGVYRILESRLTYHEDSNGNPTVMARARTRIQSYDVTVLLRGTMLAPKITVATSPYLDQADALLLATTGMLPSDVGGQGVAVGVAAAYVGRAMLDTVFGSKEEGELSFFSEMQLDVATDESEGGIRSARAEIPLLKPFYGWAEYNRTDWYNAYNGGLGIRWTLGQPLFGGGEEGAEAVDQRPPPASAPRWRIVAPDSIDTRPLEAAAAESYDDFLRSGFDLAAAYDGAHAMANLLKTKGYAAAEVDFSSDGEDPPQITFQVVPGTRYRLADLRLIDGDDWSVIDSLAEGGDDLAKILVGVDEDYLRAAQLPRWSTTWYSEVQVDEIEQVIGRLYHLAGYRRADLGPVLTTFDPSTASAFVDLVMAAGPRFAIRDVTILGASALDPDLVVDVRSLVDDLLGGAYLERRLVLAQALIRDRLTDAGYLTASVAYRVDVADDGRVEVAFELEPGPLYRLRDIDIKWVDTPPEKRRTVERYVEYKFTARKGDVLGQDVIDAGVRYLLGTGFLANVSAIRRPVPREKYRQKEEFQDVPDDGSQEVVDLVVTLTELPARSIDLEVGAGSYDILIGTIRYRDRNLFGSGRVLEIAPTASFKGYGIGLRLIDRDLFAKWLGPEHFVEYHAGWHYHEEPTFDRTRWEIGTSVNKSWNPHLSNRVFYSFVSERAEDINGGIALVDDNEFINNGTFGLGGRLDFRDLPVLPTTGWMTDAQVAWSTPPFGSDLDYFELDVTVMRILDLWDDGGLSLMLGARYRNRDPLDNAPTIPIQYRLFNGGVSSVRSFLYNDLSPVDEDGNALGGLSTGSATAELRLRLGDSAWHLAGFYDVGFNHPRPYRIGDDIGQAVGGGLRFDLPVGPIRVDAAWGPGDRFAADYDWAVQFAIGHIY